MGDFSWWAGRLSRSGNHTLLTVMERTTIGFKWVPRLISPPECKEWQELGWELFIAIPDAIWLIQTLAHVIPRNHGAVIFHSTKLAMLVNVVKLPEVITVRKSRNTMLFTAIFAPYSVCHVPGTMPAIDYDHKKERHEGTHRKYFHNLQSYTSPEKVQIKHISAEKIQKGSLVQIIHLITDKKNSWP